MAEDCRHPSLADFREDDRVICLRCGEKWSREEAVEAGLFDKINRGGDQ